MKIGTEDLIQDLIERTRKNLNEIEKLKQYSEKELNWRQASEKMECFWNALST